MGLPKFTNSTDVLKYTEPIYHNLYEIEFEKEQHSKEILYATENCLKYELKHKSITLTLNIQQDTPITKFIETFKINNTLKIKLHDGSGRVYKIITLHNTKFDNFSFIQDWNKEGCVTIDIKLKYTKMEEESLCD